MSVTLRSRNHRKRLLSDSNSTVRFTINGVVFIVGAEIPPGTRLVDFIRDHAGFKGTKYMCREGGCGSCTVTVTSNHPVTGESSTYSVNGCLVLIHMCGGWAITTVEGLGSKKKGYHNIQKRLATMNGSQCGYCSPAMVMAMHSFLEGNKYQVTKDQIEAALAGNVCRCTGYRPILNAFQSFASDASKDVQQKCADIEDLMGACAVKSTSDESEEDNLDACLIELALAPEKVEVGGTWYIVNEVREIFQIFDGLEDDQTYMLVGGNTAYGAYRPRVPVDVYIQIRNVKELRNIYIADGCVIMGSAITLTEAMDYFEKISRTNSNFAYMAILRKHLELVAHLAVRNIGTIAGNLTIKHEHREFTSDVFLLLETVGACITIRDTLGLEVSVLPEEYLNIDMHKKVITNIIFNPLIKNSYYLKTYKVMPRAQNAHAIVNAGLLFSFDPKDKLKRVIQVPRVVFGGINPNFVHARRFENSIVGKQLLNQKDFQSALSILSSELAVSYRQTSGQNGFLPEPEYDPLYRKNLALSLIYKFALGLSTAEVNPIYLSGAGMIQDERPVSQGIEDFETKKNLWPLTKPLPKLEAIAQCAGEAEYVNDLPELSEEYFASAVLADRGPATIQMIDTKRALAQPGVYAFVQAKDVPGKNLVVHSYPFQMYEDEKLFAEHETEFAGQLIGAIIADSFRTAYEAANMVKVVYSNVRTPKLDVKKILEDGDISRIVKQTELKPKAKKNDVQYKFKGAAEFGPQYHFTMEGQTTLCIPTEDGVDIYASSQWVTLVQESVAVALGIPNNRVNVKTRRVGGGYGAKLSRSCYPAVIAAVCSTVINKPVRIVMSIESMMGALGARYPIYAPYECGVDKNGVIQYLNVTFNVDKGATINEQSFMAPPFALGALDIYDTSTYHVVLNTVKTDVPTYVFARSPGTCGVQAFIEHVMDHIATVVNKDPTDVRLANLKYEGATEFYQQFREAVQYDKRRDAIRKFNQENRWRKRGISHIISLFSLQFFDVTYAVLSVFRKDATIAISTSGIEIGQGLHTKVAQACAYELGVPVEKIALKASLSNFFPNSANTGASTATDNAARCILLCCQELKTRLKPYMGNGVSWEKTISDAFENQVDLQVTKSISALQTPIPTYSFMTSATTEVEVDLLTGQHQITRADILEDVGQSINPAIDIGQIQGAYMMGIGLWTLEHMIRDKATGALLTNRTWNYKVPQAKDIPVDFRVSLVKGPLSKGPSGAFGAKAIGEPPLQAASSVMFAIKQALRSAREDAGLGNEYFHMASPFTSENIFLHSGIDPAKFSFK